MTPRSGTPAPGRRRAGGALPERLDLPFSDPLAGSLFPPLATGVHWGLDRTRAALEALDNPQERYATLHVGGTNGKGSVAATLASILGRNGLQVGCYTSPHLCSFRERFTLGGEALSREVLTARAGEIREVVARFGLTFFEAVTVLGFHAFAREGADVVVVEVGLGGRLDATNVIRPLVSAVTNVALDHADFLGETLPEVAMEKAGIIKEGVPFVTSETDPEVRGLLKSVADQRGAPFTAVDPERVISGLRVRPDGTGFTLQSSAFGTLDLFTPLAGRHQAGNAALAVEIAGDVASHFSIAPEQVVEGVARVRHPGRDQVEVVEGKTWIFDVAHNTAGVLSLVDTVDRLGLPRPLVALVGVLGDKDWRSMLPPLLARADFAVLTLPPSAPPERVWDPREAARVVAHVAPMRVEEDFVAAITLARAEAGEGTVVVTGSCHTVGAALTVLEREPLRDP
ncbi:MAG: bifunctional folylpolyglutamate synthase/dihydrofolate synthase [Gemmatimonadota bacterium]